MKKLKNVLLLAIGSMTVLSVVMTSCSSKPSSSGAAAPTVTGTTGTVAQGNTITVNGTGFTASGTTATINSASVTVTFVSSTAITVVVPTPLAAGTYNLFVTVAGQTSVVYHLVVGSSGPTSDSVAVSSLIAHWTFDTDTKEKVSSVVASHDSNDAFVSGKIGNCLSLTDGYLYYPPIHNLNLDTALESYSISMWVNIPQGQTTVLRPLFQITGNKFPNIWGNVSLELVNNGVSGDTLPLQARQVQVDGHQNGADNYAHNQTIGANYGSSTLGATGVWTFLTETYNGFGSNQTIKLFANGTMIDSAQLTTVTKPETFDPIPTGNYQGGGVGTDGIVPNDHVYIGSMAFFNHWNNTGDGYGNPAPSWTIGNYPWAGYTLTGKIDDIRVFNRELTRQQVDSLYYYGGLGK